MKDRIVTRHVNLCIEALKCEIRICSLLKDVFFCSYLMVNLRSKANMQGSIILVILDNILRDLIRNMLCSLTMLMTVHICQHFFSSSAKEFDSFLTEDCMTLDNKIILHKD